MAVPAPRFCVECGWPLADGARFCGRCGQPTIAPTPTDLPTIVEPVPPAGAPAKPPRPGPSPATTKHRPWLALAGGTLLLITLIAIAAVFALRQYNTNLASASPSNVTPLPPAKTKTAPQTPLSPTAAATPSPIATTAPPTLPPSPTNTPWPTVTPLPNPEAEEIIIGQSVRGVPITAMRVGNGPTGILLVGGLHAAYAPNTVALAQQAADYFSRNPELVPATHTLYIIISLNPDSAGEPGFTPGRLNANGVDPNRNWDCDWQQDAPIEGIVVPGSGGPAPFSEPEVKALKDLISSRNMSAVIFWEAQAPNGLVTPGGCGQTLVSGDLVNRYGRASGYRVLDYEAVTTQTIPGDASNWLDSQGIPSAFILLPNFLRLDWEENLAGILAVLHNQ